jgi:hypothetical protein
MSCNIVNTPAGQQINADGSNNYVFPYNGNGSFATLDAAFTPTNTMSDFQNKVLGSNPLYQNLQTSHNYQAPNAPNATNNQLGLSPQSEEKINNNVDQLVVAIYNKDKLYSKLNSPNCANLPSSPNSIKYPLTRHQYYPSHLGSELLEGYDPYQTSNSGKFFRTIIIIILIIILIYAIYWFYKNSKENGSLTGTTSIKSNNFAKSSALTSNRIFY